ncbi:hypothetical protein GYMLUDRAFT_45838 [Collybiopsis luxurians FD-317 M1]|uniref:Uncharacterized protein n=1 Tax=Collybiopsis luxurians FD-317 M1 TaxID=944289 RepID=A0A0D0C5A9_9AGAR|nr:hypothetical protein GYMLUDRAFT_45838 [Collybiopsis luxurians FD-317 M1]
MSIDQNRTAVASLPMGFDVDNVSPTDSEVLSNLIIPQPNSSHSLSHSLLDPLPTIPNVVNSNGPVQHPMHVPSSSNLAQAAFMDPQTPLDPAPFSNTALSSGPFITDFNSSFPVSSPVENGTAIKLPTPSHSSLSPPMNTGPSAVIHGTATAFPPGVSSLQSALIPVPTSAAQHSSAGALAAATPVALPVNLSASVASTLNSPPTTEAMTISTDESALSIGRDILHQVVQSASTAADLCRSEGSVFEAGKIVDDLRLKLAYVSDVISGIKDMSVDDGAGANAPIYPNTTDYPTPNPLPAIFEAADSFPINYQFPSSGVPQVIDANLDLNRKRCVSEIASEEIALDKSIPERRVKLKTEPQDDLPVPSIANPYPSASEVSHIHALQSPPLSRPSSPSTFGYSAKPVTTYPPPALPPSTMVIPPSAPQIPPLRSTRSDSVVPTRHTHSMSTGSINVPSPTRATLDTRPLQPVVPGRMTRSGSIGGTFVSPFTFKHSKPLAQQWRSAPAIVTSSAFSSSYLSSDTGEEDGGDDDDDEDSPASGTRSQSPPTNDVPQEYRSEVDRIFFEFLNKTCSNLDATDSKGESIHQTLMAKKMQRLDESPDFRPFKFRIQAFTNAFLEELARQGYPEEKIPMKKIRNYLWRHPYIQRYNEDGRKAKSKGNHIWNIEARKAGDGQWEFRPFYRKLAGSCPPVAYCGLRWAWKPRVWDPQASWPNIPVHYSSPSLPSWLSWKGDELSGIPTPDAQSCDITVIAKFVLDGQESQISHSFHINVAPHTSMDPAWTTRTSLAAAVNLPRNASDSMLNQLAARMSSHPSNNVSDNAPARVVVEVLQNVVARVVEKAEVSRVTHHSVGSLNHLAKQRHAVETSLAAYDLALTGPIAPETRRLAAAAESVVAEAAQNAVAPRAAAAGVTPTALLAIQVASIGEMTDLTQEALAVAVTMQGSASNDVDVIETTSTILAAHKTTPTGSPSYVSLTPSNAVSTYV